MRNIDLSKLEGYDLLDMEYIKGLDATGCLLIHKKTKAKVALLLNDDDNKVFNIAFRTPCSNDTGVSHIMEHSVLCGSDKFPVKDPFVELVKGSLNTFLNAMTSSMKTMYPVASCNDTDFKNLMDVYLDAVFHPNIYKHKEIFLQEGWSYKLDNIDDELTISGVVYNEMKGAFSSPDSVLYRYIRHTIFPDNEYSYESGGDPQYIPELSYEEFLDFHRKYYHPSNSYIYLYGDLDPVERLEFIDREYLSKYDYLQVDSALTEHVPFMEPREEYKTYPIGDNEDSKDKTYVAYTTTFGKCTDPKIYYAMNILEYALVNMPGAPVKQALVESGLAKDLTGGCMTSMDNIFTFVAVGANEEDKDKIVEVMEDTLRGIVRDGLDKDALRAALNIYEFKYREADYGGHSKGLFYGLDILESWMFDELHPFTLIDADNVFIYLNSVVETGYFETLIEQFILENNHKVILTLAPEAGLTKKTEEELKTKLAEYKASLSEKQLQDIIDETKALLKYQSEPSSVEDMEKIPMLKLEDINKESPRIEYQVKELSDVKIIYSELFTNNIAYATVSFNTANISEELLPYVGLLSKILGYIDTDNYSYVALNNMINMHTGGLDIATLIYRDAKVNEKYELRFEASIKVLYDKLPKAFEIMEEVLLHSKLDDVKRLKEIVEELKASLSSKVGNSGHSLAIGRATSYFSEASYVGDIISGVSYLWFIEELAENFDSKVSEVVDKLKEVAGLIFNKNNLVIGYTANEDGYERLTKPFADFVEKLDATEVSLCKRNLKITKKNEGLKTSAQIQYVARTGNFKKEGYEYTGVFRTLENIMDYGYLWENIRVKGGAYGCMSGYSFGGNVYFCSYRDPNLDKTNDIYEGIPEYLRNFNESDRDILKYIIGTISTLDRPKTAKGKGDAALRFYLSSITMDMVQKERDEVMSLSNEKINKLGDIIEAVLAQDNICVVGNAGKIEECKSLFMETKDLLK
ncbi:MAG: insulinase family protein [Lachnospiraceae bacterium]|nr:insulinase family protein [Lachnospiraceae bacterium]